MFLQKNCCFTTKIWSFRIKYVNYPWMPTPSPPLWCKNEDMQNIIQTPLSHFHMQGSRLGRFFRSFERPNRRLILERENYIFLGRNRTACGQVGRMFSFLRQVKHNGHQLHFLITKTTIAIDRLHLIFNVSNNSQRFFCLWF